MNERDTSAERLAAIRKDVQEFGDDADYTSEQIADLVAMIDERDQRRGMPIIRLSRRDIAILVTRHFNWTGRTKQAIDYLVLQWEKGFHDDSVRACQCVEAALKMEREETEVPNVDE